MRTPIGGYRATKTPALASDREQIFAGKVLEQLGGDFASTQSPLPGPHANRGQNRGPSQVLGPESASGA
jgi:hypothetical protein